MRHGAPFHIPLRRQIDHMSVYMFGHLDLETRQSSLLEQTRFKSVGAQLTMDTDPPSRPVLDLDKADREVYLVKVPTHIAQRWAGCDFDDELGTICFPSDPSKPPYFYEFGNNTKPHQLQPRTVHKQTAILGETEAQFAVEGRVKQMLDLKIPAPPQSRQAMQVDDVGLNIIGTQENRLLQEADRSNNDVSMAWAGGRTLDARGIAEKFVQRPKHEVLQDLIALFKIQEKYTFEDLNRQLQQPKPWLTEILSEYTTTETEYSKRHYRLRPEFR